MADTGVIYFDSYFVSFWRGNLNVFNAQFLTSFPSNRRLSRLLESSHAMTISGNHLASYSLLKYTS